MHGSTENMCFVYLPYQSLMAASMIMEDYTWWLKWSFFCIPNTFTFLFHKEQNKTTPEFQVLFPLFSSYSLLPLYLYYNYHGLYSNIQNEDVESFLYFSTLLLSDQNWLSTTQAHSLSFIGFASTPLCFL